MDDDPQTLAFTIAGQHTPAPGTHSCPTCGFELPITVGSCPKDGTPITLHGETGLKLVGNYEFIEFVGAGGMGVIYKARHPVLNRLVAIKMLHGHLVSADIIKRFQQEAEAVSSLDHANIIHVHDYGVSEHNQPYMVMDFVEGKPLSEVLKLNPLSIEAVINIMIQLAEGLQHAHERGVLHRDLKPSNIMVHDYDCSFPEVKIVDFGIAKVLESERTRMTQTGELIGTPQYMSPEQCRGGSLDARSDIYSVGCVMFEAMTGKALFAGHSMVSVIVDQMNTQPRTLGETRPDMSFPGQLEDLIAKVLAKDPADRYQSMAELAEELIAVQKIVAQQNASAWSKMRVLRLNKEQRNLFLLLLGSVVTLVTVAITSISFVRVVHDSEAKRVIHPVFTSSPLNASAILPDARAQEKRKLVHDLNMKKADDELLRSFFDVDTLVNRLDLDDHKVTSISMPNIALQKSVVALHLEGTPTSNGDLAYIVTLPELQRLYLDRTRVSDEGLKMLTSVKKLRKLSLLGDDITDRGIAYLANMRLDELTISAKRITGQALSTIAAFKHLRELTLGAYSPRGEKNLEALAAAQKLELLCLADAEISVDDLAAVSKIASLAEVELENCKIEDGALTNLKPLTHLVELSLESCRLTPELIKEIAQLEELKKLDLTETNVSDAMLAEIAGLLPKLDTLILKETDVTENGVLQLRQLPSLKVLELDDTFIRERSAEKLRKALKGVEVKF